MVTSNKVPEKKIVKMAEQNTNPMVPQRTLLGEVNEHITCTLCRGYYIDATTIVECLHSFCRSCIIKHLQVKSYCPVCEMMINSAKPNIKLDKALQDIVYKLVPGLFQKEMERRQQFYSSRPGPAACATPEQRGEDTERIIFSPEDVISFSLEYTDVSDTDSISSKSSDSNEPQNIMISTRRYMQCPAVVNISHLKKFLSMKFDIDSTQFAIDILYKRVPLPDYYTLMDIAYIYNWKRNEPMRFFYQIIDYVAIRNRLFENNRKSTHFPDRKLSPTSIEDANVSSPAPNTNEQCSEASSGTDSPMPDDGNIKKSGDSSNKVSIKSQAKDDKALDTTSYNSAPEKKNDDEVQKSQFLNSFELTAKNTSPNVKTTPTKSTVPESNNTIEILSKDNVPKNDDSLKRKHQTPPKIPEIKKLKIELEKTKVSSLSDLPSAASSSNKVEKQPEKAEKIKENTESFKNTQTSLVNNSLTNSTILQKEIKQHSVQAISKQPVLDSLGQKRNNSGSQNTASPKRKLNEASIPTQPLSIPKTVSPIKLHIPKVDAQSSGPKPLTEVLKPVVKKIPDLKPSTPVSSLSYQSKVPPINKVRMDLLANNSDPTIDRSKILSQVKSSLSLPNTNQTSGDPLKSLFDSCKINIPSSLSITLTDQKLENRNTSESIVPDQKKSVINKNLSSASNVSAHKVPSPPVHNFIEILKLPDTDPKKLNKPEGSNESKVSSTNKNEINTVQTKLGTKSSETSAKGPIPNLKPISDTKLGKQSGSLSAPITFQQTFEQQLQSLQTDKKTKLPKNKAQVPKLVPATPKSFSTANKLGNPNNKPTAINMPTLENKTNAALDLSTPHNIQCQLGPQQTKVFETMQSIANLAKKQGLPSRSLPLATSQGNVFSSISNRPNSTGASPLRVPSTSGMNQMKLDKINTPISGVSNAVRPEMSNNNKQNQSKQTINSSSAIPNLGYQITSHTSPSTALPSPQAQTRSPSSSPKLVIAEEKQSSNNSLEHNVNQSNQITSTQLPNMNVPKNESPKPSPGTSKPMKPLISTGKVSSIRQPIIPTMKSNPTISSPADYLTQPPLLSAHPGITHLLRHQMEMQTAWFKAQRQYDLFKNMSNMGHQNQNDFNNKDKQ